MGKGLGVAYRGLTISVVIPCYNEEDGIRYVLERMPPYVDEVIVVDNNCTDRTASVAASLGAQVVVERRAGYGYAYQGGFPHARRGRRRQRIQSEAGLGGIGPRFRSRGRWGGFEDDRRDCATVAVVADQGAAWQIRSGGRPRAGVG